MTGASGASSYPLVGNHRPITSRYVSDRRMNGPTCSPTAYVPAGISVGLGKGWNMHGEVYPGISDGDAPFTGWIASIEKTGLRHRFAVTCGNMRATTVDQYVAPGFSGTGRAQDLYLGFNLVRSWNLK